MATSFSNLPDSYKSAVGFMLTDDTYNGHCGYSLRFNGVEPGFNDRIRNRAIIVHGKKGGEATVLAARQYRWNSATR